MVSKVRAAWEPVIVLVHCALLHASLIALRIRDHFSVEWTLTIILPFIAS